MKQSASYNITLSRDENKLLIDFLNLFVFSDVELAGDANKRRKLKKIIAASISSGMCILGLFLGFVVWKFKHRRNSKYILPPAFLLLNLKFDYTVTIFRINFSHTLYDI